MMADISEELSSADSGSTIASSELDASDDSDLDELMVIEIAFGANKRDEIVVRHDDNPEVLAKKFIEKNSIDISRLGSIVKQITSTIEKFKTKQAELHPQSPSMDISNHPVYDNKHFENDSFHEAVDLPVEIVDEIEANWNYLDAVEHKGDRGESFNLEHLDITPIKSRPQSLLRNAQQDRIEHNYMNEISDIHHDELHDAIAAIDDRGRPIRPISSQHTLDDTQDTRNLTSQTESASAQMYNRLKQAWKSNARGGNRNVSHQQLKNNDTVTSLVSADTNVFHHPANLQSSRSSMVVTKNGTAKQVAENNNRSQDEKGDVSKSNRLYKHALLQRKQSELRQSKLEAKEKITQQNSQYKVSKKSNSVISRRYDDTDDVTRRLYHEGLERKRKKDEKERKKQTETRHENNWSCAKCGTYHIISSSESMFGSREVLIYKCDSCGWTSDDKEINRTSFKPRAFGINNEIPAQRKCEEGDVFSVLHVNNLSQSKKIMRLKKSLSEEQKILTFKPTLPQSSQNIIKKQRSNIINAGEAAESGLNLSSDLDTNEKSNAAYLKLSVSERLYKMELNRSRSSDKDDGKTKKGEVGLSRGAQPLKKSKDQVDALVTRLTYEYVDLNEKKKNALDEGGKVDANGQKLFVPKIGPPPPASSVPIDLVDGMDSKKEFHEKLLEKGEERKQRLEDLKKTYDDREKMRLKDNMLHVLPRSKEILKKSSKQNIDELFRLLLVCQQQMLSAVNSRNIEGISSRETLISPELLTKLSKEIEDYSSMRLDIRLVDPNLLTFEIQDLISAVQSKGLAQAEASTRIENSSEKSREFNKHEIFLWDFEKFEQMIQVCLKSKAEPVGHSYMVCPPKPRDELTRKLIEEDQKQYTFQPVIDKNSAKIAFMRMGRNGEKSIENILLEDAIFMKDNIRRAKESIEEQEMKECSFKPKLFKPPKSVVATYKYLPKEDNSMSREKSQLSLSSEITSPSSFHVENMHNVCSTSHISNSYKIDKELHSSNSLTSSSQVSSSSEYALGSRHGHKNHGLSAIKDISVKYNLPKSGGYSILSSSLNQSYYSSVSIKSDLNNQAESSSREIETGMTTADIPPPPPS